jgi:hypothetical protein
MADLSAVIQTAAGQPSSVRIGVITSTAPVTVNVQGALFVGVGVLSSYTPVVNHVVALLGQSTSSGTDPTSWLVLGQIIPT